MAANEEAWEAWLNTALPDSNRQQALYEVLSGKFGRMRLTDEQIAEALGEEEETRPEVIIRRTPTQDLFVENPPTYVDIFHLHDLYKSLAFKSNVMVKGPKGDGKSLSVITYAHATNSPIIIQECSEDTKKMDLMGTPSLLGEQSIFTLGCIPAAIDTANEYGRCILLFEELSALTPQVQKMLNAVTDFRRQCSMPFLGKTYKLRPGAFLWVVGTLNPSVYGGTYDLNEDLKSRFEEVDLTYPKPGQEKEIVLASCSKLYGVKMPEGFKAVVDNQQKELWYVDETLINLAIKLAGETRQQATGYALSTRDVVRLVETMAAIGVQNSLQLILCKFEGEEDKKTIKARMSSIFNPELSRMSSFWG